MNTWEELDATIISHMPFCIKWNNLKKKNAFYAEHLSAKDYEIYDVLNKWAGESLGKEADHIMDKTFYNEYFEPNHQRLMTYMEKENSEQYKKIRLFLVTGEFVESRRAFFQEYTKECWEHILTFLGEQRERMCLIIEECIQLAVKPLYQNYKKAR